ncbi:MAG: 3-deoxy-D-manno-octulosonic acid transferase, partial [Rhodocyclaceae bacterium]
FLDHVPPRVGIVLETELWPNLIAACGARNLPLLLVNARMSEKSARRYARWPKLAGDALRGFTAIAAQTDMDAQRLLRLGAREAKVFGNMKFDLEPPEAQIEAGLRRKQALDDRPVFLCASTRDGEEQLIIDALCHRIEAPPATVETVWPAQTLLVIVPRHPQRFDEVCRLIEARGLRLQRRSAGGPIAAETQVLLGDTMGEMYAYYAASDAAYIGGSLLPLGGQNLMEACAVGTPVLVGPHTFNFAEATEQAIAAGAAGRVADAEELLDHATALLSCAAARSSMGKAGREFIAAHRGATQKTLELVCGFLESAPPQP